MSFNIRYANGDLGKKNDWNNRKTMIIDIIRKYEPDIIGFQEVLFKQLQYLSSELPQYEYYGVGRRDGKKRGEFNPVFHKGLAAYKKGTFWLSGTPSVCSNTWNGGSYRLCTWIKFQEPIEFTFYNTHFDNRRRKVRNKSARLMLEKIGQISKDEPVILTGDFNFSRWSKAYSILSEDLVDSYKKANGNSIKRKQTFHRFTGNRKYLIPIHPMVTIDYIWIRDWSVGSSRIIYDAPKIEEGIFPSDHWPILADIQSK